MRRSDGGADAAHGLEAVQAIRGANTPYTLVFMDMQMPRMGGIKATEQILRRHGAQASA